MKVSSTLTKVAFHVEDAAWNKSLKFIFYRILNILNRRVRLPRVLFKTDSSGSAREIQLAKYMVPKHHGCFIDIGANVGFWTAYIAKKGVEVRAFEPNSNTVRILKNRFKTSPNVHIHEYALGEKKCFAHLKLHKHSGHDSLILMRDDFTGEQVSVTVRTLDSFRFGNVGLIKIDAEGYEIPILLGAKETIRRNKPRLVIEVHHHEPLSNQTEKICGVLRNVGYHWVIDKKRKRGTHIIAESVKPKLTNSTLEECVECGRLCDGRVHISCALHRMGEIDFEEWQRMLKDELRSIGVEFEPARNGLFFRLLSRLVTFINNYTTRLTSKQVNSENPI